MENISNAFAGCGADHILLKKRAIEAAKDRGFSFQLDSGLKGIVHRLNNPRVRNVALVSANFGKYVPQHLRSISSVCWKYFYVLTIEVNRRKIHLISYNRGLEENPLDLILKLNKNDFKPFLFVVFKDEIYHFVHPKAKLLFKSISDKLDPAICVLIAPPENRSDPLW